MTWKSFLPQNWARPLRLPTAWCRGESESGFKKEIPVQKREKMSNHFTGLSLGPPLGDQRLDLCDLYAFQSPTDPARTVIILNANPNADALHPDAIYRLNIDTDGDLLTDVALSYVFSKPQNGKQTFNVFLAKGAESRSV